MTTLSLNCKQHQPMPNHDVTTTKNHNCDYLETKYEFMTSFNINIFRNMQQTKETITNLKRLL